MRRYIIDRFEGEYAVCEDINMKMHNILKDKFPACVVEGDVFYYDGRIIVLAKEETNKCKHDVDKLIDDLLE